MSSLKMSGENCLILNCYSFRTASGISFFRTPTKNDDKIKLEEQHCCSYYSCRWRFEKANLKPNIPYLQTVPTNQNFSVYQQLIGSFLSFYPPSYSIQIDQAFVIHFQHESANIKLPVIKVAFLCGIILVSDCGCKGENNKVTTMLYDIYFIYKTVKSSRLKKLQII